mgnify:CR=1 FL=1
MVRDHAACRKPHSHPIGLCGVRVHSCFIADDRALALLNLLLSLAFFWYVSVAWAICNLDVK